MNNQPKSKKIALITGASSGIGYEFARQLDKSEDFRIEEFWLLARNKPALQELAQELKSRTKIIELDLDLNSSIQRLEEIFVAEKPDLALLVNNAGIGFYGAFDSVEREKHQSVLQLNIQSLVAISKICIPFMHKQSGIINVASILAKYDSPYHAIYAASKSFVLRFSRALRFELAPKGIRVMCLCPGAVSTPFQTKAKQQKAPQNSGQKSFMMDTAEHVVRVALKDYRRNRAISLNNISSKMLSLGSALLPKALQLRMVAKQMQAKLK